MLCCGGKHKNNVHFLDEVFEPRPPFKDLPKKRRKSVYPMTLAKQEQLIKNKEETDLDRIRNSEFTDKFLSEIIICGGCQEKTSLKERKELHHCSECNNFYCCSFAGACVGDDCSIQFEGKKQSLSYCMNCVNPYLKINIKEGGQCLCKKCETAPGIPNQYKEI